MKQPPPDDNILHRDIARAIRAMRAYGGQVVLAGGWVPRIYRGMPRFSLPLGSSAVTYDIDWVVPRRMKLVPEGTLVDVLRTEGLVPIASRDHEPPVIRYQSREWGQEELAPVYAEILTPLAGSAVGRGGEDRRLPLVQRGLRAMALEYLELLLFEPLDGDAAVIAELGLPSPWTVRVPNPGAYILQKILSAPLRSEVDKRDKDLAYIYDVVTLTRDDWSAVRTEVEKIRAARGEWRKWVEGASRHLDSWFSTEASTGPTAIARQLADRTVAPSPEAILRAVVPFRREVGI